MEYEKCKQEHEVVILEAQIGDDVSNYAELLKATSGEEKKVDSMIEAQQRLKDSLIDEIKCIDDKVSIS